MHTNLFSGTSADQDGGDAVRRYFGDFSFDSKNKVSEVINNIAKYPKKGDELTPRIKQQKNPHTSSGFFPSAS
jgi:hypothetical protein